MTFANDYSIWILLSGFALMGLNPFVRPSMVTAQFDIPTLSTAYRNEVRAIFGWFGILMAGSQLGALFNPLCEAEWLAGVLSLGSPTKNS